jgi:hypothetical protein
MELHGNAIDQNGLQRISNCSRVAIEYMFFSILIFFACENLSSMQTVWL